MDTSIVKSKPTFTYIWRNKWLTSEAQTIGDMIDFLQQAADLLRTLQARGVVLVDEGGVADDYAHLVTSDAHVAQEFGFVDESDDEDADDESVMDADCQALDLADGESTSTEPTNP
jgi:hypothetical protein